MTNQDFFLTFSFLGSEYVYIVLLTLCFWVISPKLGRQLGLWLSLSYACNIFLKALFAIPRPFHIDPSLVSPTAIATTEGYSFPSGHAQAAATFWISVALQNQRRWIWAISLLWIGLVSLSRVLLRVHYPIDIGAGFIIGSAFAWLGTRFPIKPVRHWKDRLVWIVLSLAIVVFFPALAKPVAVGLGFGITTRTQPLALNPSWRWLLSIIGLGAIFLLLKGTGWVFTAISHHLFYLWLRYAGVVLFATELWPKFGDRITRSMR